MTLSRCQCGRTTDFGSLCVFCAKEALIKQVDEEAKTTIYGSKSDDPEETDEELDS